MANTRITCGPSQRHMNMINIGEETGMFKRVARSLKEDGLIATLIKINNRILVLTKLDKLIKRYLLLKGVKNSKYEFTAAEKALGIKLNLYGYKNNHDEEIIDMRNGMIHMKIEDCELYVTEDTFKPMELSHLYNETFTLFPENPHAYETENVQI